MHTSEYPGVDRRRVRSLEMLPVWMPLNPSSASCSPGLNAGGSRVVTAAFLDWRSRRGAPRGGLFVLWRAGCATERGGLDRVVSLHVRAAAVVLLGVLRVQRLRALPQHWAVPRPPLQRQAGPGGTSKLPPRSCPPLALAAASVVLHVTLWPEGSASLAPCVDLPVSLSSLWSCAHVFYPGCSASGSRSLCLLAPWKPWGHP